jgi:hypothetical protein
MADISKEEEPADKTPDDHNGMDNDSCSDEAVECGDPVVLEYVPTKRSRRPGKFGVGKSNKAQPQGT